MLVGGEVCSWFIDGEEYMRGWMGCGKGDARVRGSALRQSSIGGKLLNAHRNRLEGLKEETAQMPSPSRF